MVILNYVITSIVAILLGQITTHLNKKLPPIAKDEITYKQLFATITKDFKFEIKYSIIYLVLFNVLLYFVGASVRFYLYLIVICALAIETSVDSRFRVIPDEVHIIILLAGIINLVFDFKNVISYVFGALIGGGIFLGLALLSLLILRKEGMGYGDVKLMLSLGFFFGAKNILVITLISFVFGAIIGGVILIVNKNKTDGYIPFGPFIAIGALIVMFVPADAIIGIYISWILEKLNLINY